MGRISKRVYVGLEGAGKSLMLARHSVRLVYRNSYWNGITGLSRPIISNLPYSQSFLDFAESKGVEVRPWRHITELETFQECDLFIDELATYFDSRLFADLPLTTRLWLAQAEKLGVDIYGGAQDFGQVDKAVRRLCKDVSEVTKVIGSRRPMKTAPPVKGVWGVCMVHTLDPRTFQGEQIEMKTRGFPSFFLIKKKDTRVFDTNMRVSLSEPPPLQKIVRHYTNPETGEIEYTQTRYR